MKINPRVNPGVKIVFPVRCELEAFFKQVKLSAMKREKNQNKTVRIGGFAPVSQASARPALRVASGSAHLVKKLRVKARPPKQE